MKNGFEKRIALERAFRLGISPRAPAAGSAWIVKAPGTGGGGGGGTEILPAPPVSIQPPAEVIPRSNGAVEIDVFWTKGAGASAVNFKGVAIYVEDPDISSGDSAPLDGSTLLDGSAQTGGAWQPVFTNTSTKSPAVVVLPAGAAHRKVRIYLAAYGPYTQALPVRATDPGPTPNIVVDVPSADFGNSGQEYAFLVSGATVQVLADYDRPDPNYNLVFAYTPPDDSIPIPPNLEAFGGCRIFYVPVNPDDTSPQFAQRVDTGLDVPILWDAGFKTPVYTAAPVKGDSFRCYFCSEDIDGHINSLVVGVTPYALAVVPPLPSAPDVTAFTISGQKIKWQLNGAFVAEALFSWNLPGKAMRYAGVYLYLVSVTGSTAFPVVLTPQQSSVASNYQLDIANIPSGQEVWTIAAISVDANGVLADDPAKFGQAGFHSPTVTWNIGPPQSGTPGGGSEYAPLVTIDAGASATATQTLSSDGVGMVSFQLGNWTDPNSNQFGAAQVAMVINNNPTKPTYWDVPGGKKSFTTPQMPSFGNIGASVPVDFYIVSDDPQGNKNSLIPGVTPKISMTYTPTGGSVIPARDGWFDPTQFGWNTSGLFQGQAFSAAIIQVGSKLIVGGGPASFGGQQNGQIAVLDSSSKLVGWIGTQQRDQGTGAATYGAWFGQLWVGGTSPLNAPLFIDSQGILEIGGIAALNGAVYPYLSVRNDAGLEQGRIGAKLTTPSGVGDSVGPNPPAGLTAGAWFTQLAVGGQNLSNWNILVVPDATNPLGSMVQMRNINLFTIDYRANSAPSGSNYEYRLDLGNSVWMGGGLTGAYVFPGIHLYEVDSGQSNFGATFLNRGLVLRGTQTQGYPVLMSLVTFNGDSTGAEVEQHFYSQLVMYSPLAPYANVISISSGSDPNTGAPSANPYMIMWNTSRQVLFQANAVGVTSGGNYSVRDYGPVIDSAGNWVGRPITSGSSQTPWLSNILGGGYNLSAVNSINCTSITTSGTITAGAYGGAYFGGAGVSCPSFGVACSGIAITPAGTNAAILVNGKSCCTSTGVWIGGTALNGATLNNGAGLTFTDINGNNWTFYIRDGLICTDE